MIPSTATALLEPMDPRDIRDYVLDFTDMLASGEQFATITISPYPESAAVGFELRSVAPYEPVELTDSTVRIWCSVLDANQLDAGFDGAGILCGIEAELVTNSTPPRRYQRSATIRVVQR